MLDDGAFKPDLRRDADTFIDTLIRHTLEGCFSAPEYGGNTHLHGWELVGLEVDSQPLGYSIEIGADTFCGPTFLRWTARFEPTSSRG